MVSTRSATAVTSEGFTLLRKRSSEGAPTLTPLPKAERRPRADEPEPEPLTDDEGGGDGQETVGTAGDDASQGTSAPVPPPPGAAPVAEEPEPE